MKSSQRSCKREVVWRDQECQESTQSCNDAKTRKYRRMNQKCKSFQAKQQRKAEACESTKSAFQRTATEKARIEIDEAKADFENQDG